MIDRKSTLELVKEYNKQESLVIHALTVEGVMRYFAKLYNEDEDLWGIVGLVHDIDYEKYPDKHCHKGKEILKDNGYDDLVIRAMMSHGYNICTDVKPESNLEKVLFTIDELTGLIYATCLMRPSKSIFDLTVKSVKKKWKQKSFAKGVDRDLILEGAKMLDKTIEEIISNTIEGMKTVADDIGLRGEINE